MTQGGAVEAAIASAYEWFTAADDYPPTVEVKEADMRRLEAIARTAQEEAERERDAAREAIRAFLVHHRAYRTTGNWMEYGPAVDGLALVLREPTDTIEGGE